MLKILQARRIQHYMNQKLSDVQVGFRKGRGTRDQIASICWIIEKATEFQKSTYLWFIDYDKAFDCVDHNKLCKILQEMWLPSLLLASWEICMQVKKQHDRGWDGWMASLTQWSWIWASSWSWWWTGQPGVLNSVGRKEWHTTEWLNWTDCVEEQSWPS